ncbi:hypothetical protein [Novosphingobium mathurense]|uniref:Uncharacterized protein n=1 Tax=Novosphingobium mathurense TaxID=428990 RepID=A0A1U6I740_9SPHN|nr:hypothetical protein [Novosphingobium mathurense]SLK03821.1 hypothetical protein SAMN06295987_104294 [Novosphingobium mathurense]
MTEQTHEEELFETEPFVTEEAQPEPVAEAVEEAPKEEPARDETGKFRAKEPATEVQQPQVQPEIRTEQPMVPLAALHEVRDELKAFKAEAERYRQQQQPQQEATPPDMFEDPEGWQAYQQQQFQGQLYSQRLEMSRRFAVQQHGEEVVNTAVEWARSKCDADPYFNQMVANSPDPVGFAYQQYQRDQIASNVDASEYEQFRAWKQAQAQVAAQTPSPAPAPKPPKSIVSDPSAGGVQHTATGQTAVFDEEFK